MISELHLSRIAVEYTFSFWIRVKKCILSIFLTEVYFLLKRQVHIVLKIVEDKCKANYMKRDRSKIEMSVRKNVGKLFSLFAFD